MTITSITALEVLDSRGNPTVEAEIIIGGNFLGRGISPSGASTGEKEAVELRDNDKKRYNGKGVLKAVENIETIISDGIVNKSFDNQKELDETLIALDSSENKSNLGANTLLAVSIAFAGRVQSLKIFHSIVS